MVSKFFFFHYNSVNSLLTQLLMRYEWGVSRTLPVMVLILCRDEFYAILVN